MAQKPCVKGLGELALRVNDFAMMRRFYQEVLGLEVLGEFGNAALLKIADGYGAHAGAWPVRSFSAGRTGTLNRRPRRLQYRPRRLRTRTAPPRGAWIDRRGEAARMGSGGLCTSMIPKGTRLSSSVTTHPSGHNKVADVTSPVTRVRRPPRRPVQLALTASSPAASRGCWTLQLKAADTSLPLALQAAWQSRAP